MNELVLIIARLQVVRRAAIVNHVPPVPRVLVPAVKIRNASAPESPADAPQTPVPALTARSADKPSALSLATSCFLLFSIREPGAVAERGKPV